MDESEYLGTFVQYSYKRVIMSQIYKLRNYMFGVWALIALIAFCFPYYTRRTIHKPILKLLGAFSFMKTGRFDKHIAHDRKDEFAYLYKAICV